VMPFGSRFPMTAAAFKEFREGEIKKSSTTPPDPCKAWD